MGWRSDWPLFQAKQEKKPKPRHKKRKEEAEHPLSSLGDSAPATSDIAAGVTVIGEASSSLAGLGMPVSANPAVITGVPPVPQAQELEKPN